MAESVPRRARDSHPGAPFTSVCSHLRADLRVLAQSLLIALQPLTGLEVQDFERLTDGTLVYTMGLNINLQSMTIEEVLAVRKKQCRELAAVVGRSLERECDEASAQEEAQRLAGLLHGAREGAQRLAGLLHGAQEEARKIEARDGAWFNENSNFVACVHALVPSPPPSRLQPLPLLPPCAWLVSSMLTVICI